MDRTLTFAAALIVALGVATVPAGAQERRDNGQRRGAARASQPASERGGRAMPRQAPSGAARPDASARPSEGRQSAPAQAARGYEGRQSAPAQGPRAYERGQSAPAQAPRGYEGGRSQSRAVPRSSERPAYPPPSYRSDDRRGSSARGGAYRPYSAPRGYVRPYARPYTRLYVRPYNYVPYRPFAFSRPYYSFRPRLSIGFGLWIGFPVRYPTAYLGAYRPRVYGYYPGSSYGAVSIYGGVSFDIQPSDADLFVDGEYAGPIGMFTPSSEPLTLTPGVHRIAVQREGFQPMEWDVTIEPGEVIPYRGDMQRY